MAAGQSQGSRASAPDGVVPGAEEGLDPSTELRTGFARPGPSTGLGTNGAGDAASAWPDVSRRAVLGAAVALSPSRRRFGRLTGSSG